VKTCGLYIRRASIVWLPLPLPSSNLNNTITAPPLHPWSHVKPVHSLPRTLINIGSFIRLHLTSINHHSHLNLTRGQGLSHMSGTPHPGLDICIQQSTAIQRRARPCLSVETKHWPRPAYHGCTAWGLRSRVIDLECFFGCRTLFSLFHLQLITLVTPYRSLSWKEGVG